MTQSQVLDRLLQLEIDDDKYETAMNAIDTYMRVLDSVELDLSADDIIRWFDFASTEEVQDVCEMVKPSWQYHQVYSNA